MGVFDSLKTAAYTPAQVDALKGNKTAQNFAANLGFGTTQAQRDAAANLKASQSAYEELNPPDLIKEKADLAKASLEGQSELGGIKLNQSDLQAQQDQLGALRNLAANGGRNAASDANLAAIQQSENANARGQRDAILQNANARGMGGSGASLLAQLSSSQNATNNQSMQDMNVLGQQANTALQAGNSAASLGANMGNTDYAQQAARAQANDAIARFNAGQNTAMNQFNANTMNQAQQYNTGLQQTGYQNQFQKQAGIAGSNLAGVNYNQAQANMGAQQAGNILGAGIKLGTAAGQSSGGGGGGGGAAQAAAMAASHGGRVPGSPTVKGDSYLNDSVTVKTSPGEVIVPRSLAKGGSPLDISNFVKNPPSIKPPNSDREAMLSALKNIRKRG